MDHESATMLGKASVIPTDLNWASLLRLDGDGLEAHYVHILTVLGKGSGLIPTIFCKDGGGRTRMTSLQRAIK